MTGKNRTENTTGSVKSFLSRWAVNTMGMLLFFAGFFRPGFGADTIGQAYMPLININAAFQYGRYLTYVLDIIAYRLGYSMDGQYKTTYLVFILMLALSVTIIQQIFLRVLWGHSFLLVSGIWAVSMMPLANVLFSEMYMFPEAMIGYSLCYVTASLAAYLICRTGGRKGWITGIIMIFVSCMFYQNGVFFAAILVLLYFYLDQWTSFGQSSDSFRNYFLRSAAVVAAACAAGFINIKMQEFLQKTDIGKGAGKDKYFGINADCFRMLAYYLKTFFATSLQLLPRLYLPLLFLLLSDVLIILVLVKQKRYLQILMTLFTQFVMFGLACSIPLLMEEIHFAPRIIFLIYEALAADACMAFAVLQSGSDASDADKDHGADRRFRMARLLAGACALFFALQAFFTVQIAENHALTNRQDLIYAALIQQKIRKYEAKTGNKVKKVAAVRDEISAHYYEGIYYTWEQINERVMGMSNVSLLCYTAEDGRKFEFADMDEEVFNTHFKGRNWDEFDVDEQVIIIGDTLYWCVF